MKKKHAKKAKKLTKMFKRRTAKKMKAGSKLPLARPRNDVGKLRSLALIKSENNPIISPKSKNGWENWQVFNPGAILIGNKIHFLYRAIGDDGISRLGYANSKDGFSIEKRLSYPVYEHRLTRQPAIFYSCASGSCFGGVEDPRIVRIDNEDKLYMTYTACNGGLRVGLTSITVTDFLNKRWNWKNVVLISPLGQVHKNWVIFPDKINGKYAILHSLSPAIQIAYFDSLEFDGHTFISSYYDKSECREGYWEKRMRGAGPPPIKTKYGWLLFYHAMDKYDPGKYKLGAMLLDLDEPTKILYRSLKPILEPSEVYEYNGFKGGVIYSLGAVVKAGTLFVYYGAADSYIGAAYANLNVFLEALKNYTKPQLKLKIVKKITNEKNK